MSGRDPIPRERLLLMLVVAAAAMAAGGPSPSSAHEHHQVGGSIWSWSIPPTASFYQDWSNITSVVAGDALVFRFETGFYDVVQVSRRGLEDCAGENHFGKFLVGPVTVPVDRADVYYFICSIGNYCRLGMKLVVVVQPHRDHMT